MHRRNRTRRLGAGSFVSAEGGGPRMRKILLYPSREGNDSWRSSLFEQYLRIV